MLHGDGRNRWFDKVGKRTEGGGSAVTAATEVVDAWQVTHTADAYADQQPLAPPQCINLIVCANGRAGVSWEHAWGDGAAGGYRGVGGAAAKGCRGGGRCMSLLPLS